MPAPARSARVARTDQSGPRYPPTMVVTAHRRRPKAPLHGGAFVCLGTGPREGMPGRPHRPLESPKVLVLRQHDLASLQDSIELQGILVPLTVVRSGSEYVFLDGERRM